MKDFFTELFLILIMAGCLVFIGVGIGYEMFNKPAEVIDIQYPDFNTTITLPREHKTIIITEGGN